MLELAGRLGVERRRAREALKVAWDAQRPFTRRSRNAGARWLPACARARWPSSSSAAPTTPATMA